MAPPFTVVPRVRSLALRLARVAQGAFDVAIAGANSHDWDLAAADLLVHEAGGALTPVGGGPIIYNLPVPRHGMLVAAGRDRHATLIDLLRGWTPRVFINRGSSGRIEQHVGHRFRTQHPSNCSTSSSAASLRGVASTEFKDLDKLDIVGVYPNYASAYAAWKRKRRARSTTRRCGYFIVHLHRLLDPGSEAPPR